MTLHPASHSAAASHAALVARTAQQIHRTLPPHIDILDELIHVGRVAFLEAISRFDWQDDENPTFPRFAYLRIRGAMYDQLRRNDSVPHRIRARRRQVARLDARHQAETGERLSPEELVSEGVSLRVQSALADVREAVSLDANMDQGALLADERPNPEEQFHYNEVRSILQGALNALTPQEQFVITRYFDHSFTLLQIAAHLDCSESRVCQIKRNALRRMRAALETIGVSDASFAR